MATGSLPLGCCSINLYMEAVSSDCSGHDRALGEKGQSDVFFDGDIDLTPGCGRLHQLNNLPID
ncbi:hypothetical protein T10_6157 [Trichinella papuae]|uniref:Uncharacterized protein n=1 Tax=Trichinella papuae TaxID=268474 RepID=A0A0V1MGY3_9BILA|nr:hypothetical protein T10_6157 [Trichinella papuae]